VQCLRDFDLYLVGSASANARGTLCFALEGRSGNNCTLSTFCKDTFCGYDFSLSVVMILPTPSLLSLRWGRGR
jgi:hypothetical protein